MKYTIKTAICITLLSMLLVPTVYAGSSQASGWATASDGDAIAFSTGFGDEVLLGSVAAVEGPADVNAVGNAYVTGEVTSVSVGSTGTTGEDNNFAGAFAFAHGIGDTSGFTWAYAWR